MARIDNVKKVVYLTGNEDIDESLKVAQLLSLGYTAKDEADSKPKKKKKSTTKSRAFYASALNAEQFEEFNKIASKPYGYMKAVHWANRELGIEKAKPAK